MIKFVSYCSFFPSQPVTSCPFTFSSNRNFVRVFFKLFISSLCTQISFPGPKSLGFELRYWSLFCKWLKSIMTSNIMLYTFKSLGNVSMCLWNCWVLKVIFYRYNILSCQKCLLKFLWNNFRITTNASLTSTFVYVCSTLLQFRKYQLAFKTKGILHALNSLEILNFALNELPHGTLRLTNSP